MAMNDDAAPHPHTILSNPPRPLLHPAPGRCIVRIVPRVLEARTESGLAAALDGRYENQPMVGQLYEIGDPTSDRENAIARWAMAEAETEHLFVFSTFGSGTPYWNDEMRKMLPVGYDFTWLQGLRLFDITQLSCSIEGSGTFGEAPRAPRLVDLVSSDEVQA